MALLRLESLISNGMVPHARIFHSNFQILPSMIKRMRKPVRAMAWGVKKLNLDRRLSMKVRVFVFDGGQSLRRERNRSFAVTIRKHDLRVCLNLQFTNDSWAALM